MLYLYISLGVIAFILLVLFIIYVIVFYAPSKYDYSLPKGEQFEANKELMLKLIEDARNVPFEDVYIKSHDNKKLHGFVHDNNSKEVAICFHGYRGNGIRDFAGGIKLLNELGQTIILADERGQGKSYSHTMTFGIKEKDDVASWVNYAIDRFGDDIEIILYGVSMGATTVCMASSQELRNIKAIVADAPFSSPKDIIKKVTKKDVKLPPSIFYPLIYLSAVIFGHFNLHKTTAKDEVKNSKYKILIIHGEEDRFVPCDMSKEIEESNPNMVKRITFHKAGHALSFIEDYDRYKKEVLDFINEK